MALTWMIVAAFLVDLAVGDPPRPTHPVVIIGKTISMIERSLRPVCRTKRSETVAGGALAVAVTAGAYCVTALLLWAAYELSTFAGVLLNVWMLSTVLAARDLADAAHKVYMPLLQGALPLARSSLSMIVGRDTEHLDEAEIVRAVVETVAENTSDGVVAPLVFAFIGGAPLAMAYKAVNTLDSMVGYRDERYINFGRASAKLDDLVNYVPARVSGVLLVAASAITGDDWRRAWRVMLRDGRRHPSPNSGLGEAAVAGALGARLGGLNYYRGQRSFRSYLGDETQQLRPGHIKLAVRLMRCSAALALIAGCVLRTCLLLCRGVGL